MLSSVYGREASGQLITILLNICCGDGKRKLVDYTTYINLLKNGASYPRN